MPTPFEDESRRRRSLAIARFRDVCAEWELTDSLFYETGAVFAPAVDLQLRDGRLASVSAHANGLSVLLGANEDLHDLDDLPFDEALSRAVQLVTEEYERRGVGA